MEETPVPPLGCDAANSKKNIIQSGYRNQIQNALRSFIRRRVTDIG